MAIRANKESDVTDERDSAPCEVLSATCHTLDAYNDAKHCIHVHVLCCFTDFLSVLCFMEHDHRLNRVEFILFVGNIVLWKGRSLETKLWEALICKWLQI